MTNQFLQPFLPLSYTLELKPTGSGNAYAIIAPKGYEGETYRDKQLQFKLEYKS